MKVENKTAPPSLEANQGGGLYNGDLNITNHAASVKKFDIEAITERAAIIEEGHGVSRLQAENMAADLYQLTTEERAAIFPMPRRAGFDAVLFMAERSFSFLPWDEQRNQPALKWGGENQKNFSNCRNKLLEWQAQGYRCDSDTEAVISHAWRKNTARAVS